MLKKIKLILGWLGLIFYLLTIPFVMPINNAQSVPITSCADIYFVQASDWLSKISEKLLGNLAAYPAVVIATNQQHQLDISFPEIINPDDIEVGWKLCIPSFTDAELLLNSSTLPVVESPIIPLEVYTLDHFVNEFNFSLLVNPNWIYSSPKRVAKYEVLAKDQERFDSYGYRTNYFWNEHLSNSYYISHGLFRTIPENIKVYTAPWKTAYPRYRYPPNVTLPTGLTTNQFGWRGPHIELNKADNTIRIACVGASTTVGGHPLPYSYPEHLQHWLNLWSIENGYNINFEVINAGREGLSAIDIAAVVRYEILPMEVDYVIYYEGANQFTPQSMITYPEDVVFGKPPPGAIPNFSNIESEDKTLLDHLSEYSALASRTRSLVEEMTLTGQEPEKPEQVFHLAAGIDELRPRREYLDNKLALNRILIDLDHIKQNLDANNVKMFMSTFDWFVFDEMILDVSRHRNLYGYLNRMYWPISYANMRRMADFQNRVFKMWARENRVPIIEVAALMPKEPDLYDDAIHKTQLGTRIRAWVTFQSILPVLKQDIDRGVVPKPDQVFIETHPYIDFTSYYTRTIVME